MKKVVLFVLGAFLVNLSAFLAPVRAVDTVSVAECTMLESHWQSAKNQYLEQGFRPEYDTLSGIKFWLGGSGTINWDIVALEQDDSVIASGSIDYDSPGPYSQNFTPVSVYPGDHYSIDITSFTDSSWRTSSNADCYNITNAQVNGAVPADLQVKDYNFIIYGYNTPAEVASTPPVATAPATTATPIDTSNSLPPTSSTSTSIGAPTGLVASSTVADTGNIISLKWTASKADDIIGYKIYRSQTENSEFTSIATTAKNVIEATDSHVVAGTTYYYFVRAYKDSNESASSNTATITAVSAKITAKNSATTSVLASNKSFLQKTKDFVKQNLLNILPALIGFLLLLGVAIYTIIKHSRQKTKIEKP